MLLSLVISVRENAKDLLPRGSLLIGWVGRFSELRDNGDIEVGDGLDGGVIEVAHGFVFEQPPVRLDGRFGAAETNVCMAALVTLSAGVWTREAVVREWAWVVEWVVCVGGVS